MPLQQGGIFHRSSDVDQETERQIKDIFQSIDREIERLSRERGLTISQVKLREPVQLCVLVGDSDIFVAATSQIPGGVSREQFVDWSGKSMDMATALRLAERDLGFREAFGFQMLREILDLDDDQKQSAVLQLAEGYIGYEIANLEREQRIVRINPMFQGREFLINEELVFVLSPFAEPFDTIYEDHIKPSVESIQDLNCLRADDIYDNRAIIEDIWQHINEARLLVAELTGRNGNVFYEAGIAHTIGKEVILITQTMDDVPFDLRYLRCIVYEYTPRGISVLEENLKNTISTILSRQS